MVEQTTTGTGTATSTTYGQYYCSFRLPCGICTRTNSICPLGSGWTAWWQTTPYSPWWGIYPPTVTNPTITTQTGTDVTLNMATGETTAKCDMSQYERGEWKKGD